MFGRKKLSWWQYVKSFHGKFSTSPTFPDQFFSWSRNSFVYLNSVSIFFAVNKFILTYQFLVDEDIQIFFDQNLSHIVERKTSKRFLFLKDNMGSVYSFWDLRYENHRNFPSNEHSNNQPERRSNQDSLKSVVKTVFYR